MMSRIVALLLLAVGLHAAETVKIRNAHAVVFEDRLAPGETSVLRGDRARGLPGVIVYCQAGAVEMTGSDGKPRAAAVKEGEVVFVPPDPLILKNTGTAPLRIVRVDFPGSGSSTTWGNEGIPHYKLLLENRYARVYNIQVPAGATEPQHTHKDRVVVCLSGAELIHTMPDGRQEPATLKTGEIDWRLGATHVGHNIGKTDLWVVAIEPK